MASSKWLNQCHLYYQRNPKRTPTGCKPLPMFDWGDRTDPSTRAVSVSQKEGPLVAPMPGVHLASLSPTDSGVFAFSRNSPQNLYFPPLSPKQLTHLARPLTGGRPSVCLRLGRLCLQAPQVPLPSNGIPQTKEPASPKKNPKRCPKPRSSGPPQKRGAPPQILFTRLAVRQLRHDQRKAALSDTMQSGFLRVPSAGVPEPPELRENTRSFRRESTAF